MTRVVMGSMPPVLCSEGLTPADLSDHPSRSRHATPGNALDCAPACRRHGHSIDAKPRRRPSGQSLRIALYSYNYAPEPTGIPFYNTQACMWLNNRLGWEVTVHTGIPHYPWWRVPDAYAKRDYRHRRGDEILDHVHVERVPHYIPSPPVGALKRIGLDASWLLATAWRSLWQQTRPHALIMIAPPFLSGLLGIWLRWRWRIPVFYHVQDLQVDAAIDLRMLPRWLGRILQTLDRHILLHQDAVSTVSLGMRRRLMAKTGRRRPIALWPNWTDTAAMRELPRDNALRHALSPRPPLPDRILVLYSGNLGRKQGLEVVLATAPLVRDLPVHFAIVGDGAERIFLESESRRLGCSNVSFHHLVPQEHLATLLSAADFHLIPQRREAADRVMPSKLLNIMACARPVVVTAMPHTELARIVMHSGCGVVVPPGDAIALAAAVRTLSLDADVRQRMGRAGRSYVKANLDIHPVMARFAARILLMTAASRNIGP